MTVVLRALGATGVVAIYEGGDDDPFDNPLDHLSNGRLKFHSSLDYPKVVSEHTGSISLPARGPVGGVFTATYNLFSHGLGGQPWVLGSFDIGGTPVAAVGSVPVQFVNAKHWARWVSIGADSTYVMAYEYLVMESSFSTIDALSLPYTVWVTDELL